MPHSSPAANAAMPETPPAVSIIIPTFNRLEVLQLCLNHLERQTMRAFEVILVDDGSTDDTASWIADFCRRTPLRLQSVRQANAGPARARNAGIQLAQAPLCLIIGDDILCQPRFVESHVDFHRRNPAPNMAALGFTHWSETAQTVTPFMRWMDSSGTQFAYGDLLAGVQPDWRHFYTSNLSLKTELLRRQPFSERFPDANMEDMELGYRLQVKEGLRLTFLPEAVAGHVHPIDFRRACVRAFRTGKSLAVFDQLWPDRPRAAHGPLFNALRRLLAKQAWLLPPLTAATDWLTRHRCPNPLIQFTLQCHTTVARYQKSNQLS